MDGQGLPGVVCLSWSTPLDVIQDFADDFEIGDVDNS